MTPQGAVDEAVLARIFELRADGVGVIEGARAAPPFRPHLRPNATAAGSLPCSSGVGSRSGFSPVAMSIIDLASWLGSLGRLGWVIRSSDEGHALS